MKLIKQLNSNIKNITIVEDDGGAVASGAIAATPYNMLSTMITRPTKHPKIIKYGTVPYKSFKQNKKSKLADIFHVLESEFGPDMGNKNFDSVDVLSKLKNLQSKESVEYKNTVTFGLVDTNDKTIRVTIPKDQSSSFEQDLQHFMGEYSENQSPPEIAEILFKLKDRYNIINVEWPKVEEDEESSTLNPEDQQSDTGDMNEEIPMEEPLEEPSTDKTTDLLNQVIDMMKADAEARKAEAHARESEAKAKQADAARHQAMARVSQEEQLLDMEAFQKQEKEQEKEAKRLAQLAKWKRDMSDYDEDKVAPERPQYDFLPGEENEEYQAIKYGKKPKPKFTGKVQPADIAKFIMSKR